MSDMDRVHWDAQQQWINEEMRRNAGLRFDEADIWTPEDSRRTAGLVVFLVLAGLALACAAVVAVGLVIR